MAEAISRFTKIDAEVDDHLLLDSHRILRYPFVYIGVDRGFRPTQNEIKNFGDYLRSGGFALIENMNVGSAEGKGSLKQLVKSALGRGVRFKNLSNRSPIYHSFFDFPDGPPLSPFPSAGTNRVSRYLEGVRPLLQHLRSAPGHVFWEGRVSLADQRVLPSLEGVSSRQLTDIYLLAEAIERGGNLVTLDSHINASRVPGGAGALVVVC